MHAGMRRVPAERARHAKRLGHVQAGSGAAFPILAGNGNGNATTATPLGPLTPSSQAVPTTTSTSHSSSSALSSSSTILSSSSAPRSSTATTSTSSVAFSTGTQSLTPSSSTDTSPAILPSSSPIPPPTPTPNATAATSSGLSGGAIAGIIAGAAIVGAALIVLLIRKTYLRRRERKRISWGGAPGLGADTLDKSIPSFPDISERPAPSPHRNVPPSPFGAYSQSMYSTHALPLAHMQSPTTPTYATPTPPPATYNNPTPVVAYPTHHNSLAYRGTGISTPVPPVRAQNHPVEVMVKCTFVPTLPDELSITTGERISSSNSMMMAGTCARM
ncbi:hypothetical protein JVT61DRAFT_2299 [Boletus reticuloceps]|uniref:Uncharacterized protein n=1 Tax=Boletus reticuloceps TaxID=495285 RepID=A0A8I2YQG2_9AGAM|nr:hypothetical protein JVT61DRAFT_2299 [Boletus reticuloceps]